MRSLIKQANENKQAGFLKILLVSVLVAAVLYFVYLTGGTKKVYLHLMYIPIILSSLFWGSFGGLIVGTVSGLLAGPLMPLDVVSGIMQESTNWISRIFLFSLIGFFTGYILDWINQLNKEAQDRNLSSPFYQLPNTTKLIFDIENCIKSKEYFKIMSIKLTNLDGIEKYVDNELVLDLVKDLARQLEHRCGRKAVYSYGKDELILLAFEDCVEDYEEKIDQVLGHYFMFPISINGYDIRVSLKVGVYEYRGEDISPTEIYNKARIAHEQGDDKESGVYFYDVNLENRRREMHDITGALLESIRKNELFIMYQPKIDIVNNKISGVEALVRWKRNGDELIGPDTFIPIAEEIGFIKEISKFIFDNTTTQMEVWKTKNIDVRCAVNASAKELLDSDFISWGSDIITKKKVNRSDIEIEITERAIAYNDKRLIETMNYLKKRGYQISIDDFGTGYNSLMSLGEIPFDILKIDKYFIDRVDRNEIKELVKHLIEYSHAFGKIVIAEGVETEEQLNILKELKCDEVQGYYFSKPLLPDDFEEFYIKFNQKKSIEFSFAAKK
jgi:EAL domain-containing protein (putative c-di-GMP-specific phosphodiesterase class I)